MTSKADLQARLEFHRAAAEKLRAAYIALVDGGVASYSVGSRSLTKLDIGKIMDEIRAHEKAIDGLEEQLMGWKRRKTVAAVPRDW